MSTYAPGVAATVRLLRLQLDGATVQYIIDFDTLELAIIGRAGQIGPTYSTRDGTILSNLEDGSIPPGRWVATIIVPTTEDSYYLRWTATLQVDLATVRGVFTEDFVVRAP